MGPSSDFWEALWLTLRLALATTGLLLIVGLPLALWTVRNGRKIPLLAEALITVPTVLAPTVIAFYLLMLFAPQTWTGALWVRMTGHPFALSFTGLVAGSFVYSLPFAFKPFCAALGAVPRELIEDALLNGASRWQSFWNVTLPLSRRGIAAGTVLSFAHTLGGFGVVFMIGGSVPGGARVASVALFEEFQKMHYGVAHAYAATLLGMAFVLILAVTILHRSAETAE